MKLKIVGAKTLTNFSQEIQKGFDLISAPDHLFELYQIHAAPHSLVDDLEIIKQIDTSTHPKLLLIHRPDELLLNAELTKFISDHPEFKIILLGDLALTIPFWNQRRSQIKVIPHPYFHLTLPEKSPKYIIGTFTTWGEMRKLEHYLGLIKELKALPVASYIHAQIGGPNLNRREVLNSIVEISETYFVPHFNVQLYHLHGSKRLAESSGSLHSGISIPVIFEANGIERTEGVQVVKVIADEALQVINYQQAAKEIANIIENHQVEELLQFNLNKAQNNTTAAFATRVIEFFEL